MTDGSHNIIFDPMSGKLCSKRKAAADQTPISPVHDAVLHHDNISLPTSAGKKQIPEDIEFTDTCIHIQQHSRTSGKKPGTALQTRKKKLHTPREHQFFKEQYLHDIWCTSPGMHVVVTTSFTPEFMRNFAALITRY